MSIAFDNSYARLPPRFHARVVLDPVAAPRLIRLNEPLARELGLDPAWLASPDGVAMLSASRLPDEAAGIALAYAGHQFGQFVPQLGDGRAMLVGEVIDSHGRRRDIHLKGSGRTAFSRGGDGRAALGPVLREYLVSEAMAAIGVPTTRALAAVTTGEEVYRERPLPGAVIARVAASHIRVGSFQFFAARGDTDGLRVLADHAIARHDPDLDGTDDRYAAFLHRVIARQASLIARWLGIGFIHGVMNTDNMTVSGETIDYGPCAFMDAYDPGKVFSSIDRGGRYAFANQPRIGQWNLARLAEAMLPLFDADEDKALAIAQDAIERFPPAFEAAMRGVWMEKLGILAHEPDDLALAQDLLSLMAQGEADFTLTLRALTRFAAEPATENAFRAAFADPAATGDWIARWQARLARDPDPAGGRADVMTRANPAMIPRNHLVEAVIRAAVDADDFAPFEALLAALTKPFEDPADPAFARPPLPAERVTQTFCGT
jgi:uncharacterized protein YdiU (UPF0061 family)